MPIANYCLPAILNDVCRRLEDVFVHVEISPYFTHFRYVFCSGFGTLTLKDFINRIQLLLDVATGDSGEYVLNKLVGDCTLIAEIFIVIITKISQLSF